MEKFTTNLMGADGKTVVRALELEFDFGTDMASAAKLHGADVVFAMFKRAAVVDAQQWTRSRLKKTGEDKKSDAAIREEFRKEFKLDIGKRIDPAARFERVTKALDGLTEEQKAELAKMLAAQAKPAAAKKRA